MGRIGALLGAGAIAATVMSAAAQSPAQKPSFEVASIKPTDQRGPINTPPGGRFIAAGQPLSRLIAYAYRLRDDQIIGGPTWASTDLWEIEAKATEGSVPPKTPFSWTQAAALERLTQPDAIAFMLQSLLEDRFHLRLHGETKEFPVFEIVVAKGGTKIRLADDQNPAIPKEERLAPLSNPWQGLPPIKPGEFRIGGGHDGKHFEAKALPIWVLANQLTAMLKQTVIEKTELKGLYDWKLEWQSDPSDETRNAQSPVQADPAGVSIFTAIQEQLGLRLVSTKGPVEVLVIDSVQKPTVN